MAMNEDAVKTELLLLYRNNYALREDQQVAKAKDDARLREEIDVLRREKLDSEQREQEDTAQIQALRAKIADLRKAAAGDATKITTLGEGLDKTKQENRQLTTENAALQDKNNELNRLLEQIQTKVTQLEGQLAPIGSRPFPLKRPARVESTRAPVQQTQGDQAGSNPGRSLATRRRIQSMTDGALSEPEDPVVSSLEGSDDEGQRRGPSPRKRRRAEKTSNADNADDADGVDGPEGSEITSDDLRSAFPEQAAELDAAQALKGMRRAYRIFELCGQLLALLDLSSTPGGGGLYERFARPLGATGRTVQLSAWDVLVATGCYRKVATYRIQHWRCTRLRGRYEHFFEHASGAQRLQDITDDEARKILQDVYQFFNGQPSGRLSEQTWDKRMKTLAECLGDKTS